MYKIYQNLIYTLLVILSSVLVVTCESCEYPQSPLADNNNESPKEDPIMPPTANNQAEAADTNPLPQAEETSKKKRREKQQKIKQEIISTEASYNQSLHSLQKFYLTPLLEAKGFKGKKKKKIKKFATKLQSVLDPLIQLSDNLAKELQAQSSLGEVITNTNLGEILRKYAPDFSALTAFANSYVEILGQFENLSKENSSFAKFLKEQGEIPEVDRHDFQDYLITPVQRLPRYKLLLGELLKNIPQEDKVDHQAIQQALNAIIQSLSTVNASVAHVAQQATDNNKKGFFNKKGNKR